MKILELNRLEAGYRQRPVLRGIDLVLEDNFFCGVIGPNGSGKTTLFRAITGLLPASGTITWWGERQRPGSRRDLARRIAVVSQDEAVVPGLTVADYVLLGRLPHFTPLQFRENARDRAAAERALALTGAEVLAGRPCSELSSGERQRAAIARALAQEPEVLLLDEPTSHLDPGGQIDTMDRLAALHADGMAVMVILHDLNLAGEYCRQLLLLDRGRVHARGTPAAVLTYENIEAVYRTVVVTRTNPITGRPFVIPVPAAYRRGAAGERKNTASNEQKAAGG